MKTVKRNVCQLVGMYEGSYMDAAARIIDAVIILLVSSSFSVNFIKRLLKRGASPATSAVPAGSAAK